jgi:hypothetical protein
MSRTAFATRFKETMRTSANTWRRSDCTLRNTLLIAAG